MALIADGANISGLTGGVAGPWSNAASPCFDMAVPVVRTIVACPVANPVALELCDDGDGTVTFTLADAQDTAAATNINMVDADNGDDGANFTVTYHATQADADADQNPIIMQDVSTATSPVTVYVRVDDGNLCFDTAEITLTMNALPTATITETDMSGTTNDDSIICAGDEATLTATMGYTYEWSDASQTTNSITVSPTTTTTYTVTVTDGNDCSITVTHEIVVNQVPVGAITVTENSGTADDGTICVGDDVTLTASSDIAGSTYLWDDASASTTAAITVSPTADATYNVTITSNGCTDVETVNIIVNPLPTVTAAAICTGAGGPGSGEITVTASGTGTLMYSLDGAPAVTTNVFSNVANGSHTITVSDDNCTNTITVGVSCNVVCFVDAGSLDMPAGGCQAITDGTDANITVGAYGFNNAYNQVFFLVQGATIIEYVEIPVGSTDITVTFPTAQAAGSYTVYAVNYETGDFDPATTTVIEIANLPETYTSGACAVEAANSPTPIEVCDPACACDDGTDSGTITVATATAYNPAYTQTYVCLLYTSPSPRD